MTALTAATLVVFSRPAAAVEIYGQVGLPGYGLGIAQPIGPLLTLRGDLVTLGNRTKDVDEEGITYRGRLKASRGGLFIDFFPFAGAFRLTGGVTSNQYKLDLDASGAGRTINVGGTDYTLGANDGLAVQVKYPSTTPYLGIGWGHGTGSGLRFSVDIGASIGKAKLDATGRGQLATPQAQADIDRELAELRDGVGKAKVLPQISFSLGFSF